MGVKLCAISVLEAESLLLENLLHAVRTCRTEFSVERFVGLPRSENLLFRVHSLHYLLHSSHLIAVVEKIMDL